MKRHCMNKARLYYEIPGGRSLQLAISLIYDRVLPTESDRWYYVCDKRLSFTMENSILFRIDSYLTLNIQP